MSGRMWRRVLLSSVLASVAGVLLHFALEWSGRHPLVAIFASQNESTWEHMKLAFWPCLFVGIAWRWMYDEPPGWLPGVATFAIGAAVLIPIIFYGYTAILGTHYFALDLATFFVSVILGAIGGVMLLPKQMSRATHVVAGVALALAVLAFATLSADPPDWFLFQPPA